MKERSEACPSLGEKALLTYDRTELLWPRVARDFERQTLQTDPVATCQHHSPPVSRPLDGRHDGWSPLRWSPISARFFDRIGRHASLTPLSTRCSLVWTLTYRPIDRG